MMGLNFDEGPSRINRTNRAVTLTNNKAFICPENDVIVSDESGELSVSNFHMGSYVTAAYFQCNSQKGQPVPTSPLGFIKFKNFSVNCGNYRPLITRVGDTTKKVFISDGAMWAKTSPPDADFSWNGQNGTTPFAYFTDVGPWDGFTRSFDGTDNGGVDRVYAFRHGDRKPVVATGTGSSLSILKTYRFNCAFFDGHVETLDGYTALNPVYWVPKGTGFPDNSEFSIEAAPLWIPSGTLTVNQ